MQERFKQLLPRIIYWWTTLTKIVTSAGWLVLAVIPLSVVFVFALGWTSFAAALVLSIFLLIVAFPFVIGKPKYEITFNIEYDRVIAGNKVRGTASIKNVGNRMTFGSRIEIPMLCENDESLSTMIILSTPPIRPGHTHNEDFVLPTKRRAVFNVGPVKAVKTDPFHLLKIEHTYTRVSKLFVHPQTLPLPSSEIGMIRDIDGDATDRVTVSDISFHDIRDYAPGDPIKNINWKSTAKFDKLMVRTFEESRRAKIVFALSTNSGDYSNDDEFELVISALASVGQRAAMDSRDIEVVTSMAPSQFAYQQNLDIIIHSNKTPRGVLDSFSSASKSYRDLRIVDVCQKISDKINDISLCVLGIGSNFDLRNVQKAALSLPNNTNMIAICANEMQEPKVSKIDNITFIQISVLNDLKQIVARQVL